MEVIDREESVLSTPPFWQHSDHNHRRPRLTRTSSIVFNSGAVLIVVIVAALAIVFVVVPSLVSFASQVLKPLSVKKSWDSLNLVLVLFAVVCGFLSRTANGGGGEEVRETPRWRESTPRNRWGEEEASGRSHGSASLGRMRSSSSYPDLRLESSWMDDERWRFHDDTEVSDYHHRTFGHDHQRLIHRRREIEREDQSLREGLGLEMKTVKVDSVQSRPMPPPLQPRSSSTPHKEEAVVKRKPKRTHQAIEKQKDQDTLTSPQPPALAEERREAEEKIGGARGREFLISLRKKKKKQKSQRSLENFDAIVSSSIYLPPPPPPPPPPSVFLTMFSSKKVRTKKSLPSPKSPPPPPPPPPPPQTIRISKQRAQTKPVPVNQQPPSHAELAVETIGNESPLIPIPPPPPPPPFWVREWSFSRRGDFVRMKSDISSRSESPEPLGGKESPMADVSPAMSPAWRFCPSPDVDTKADNFIARFRSRLMLEKDNSMRERDGVGIVGAAGKSILGLSSAQDED